MNHQDRNQTLPATGKSMDLSEFQTQIERPLRMKTDEFQREGRLRHIIFSSQLNPAVLEKLFYTADLIRQLSRAKEGIDQLRGLLSHKRAMLYFTQPSTRTFLSFMAACQILGLTCNEVRDPKTSSESKRESPMDSIRMFSSYFDIIIMRSPEARFAECCAYLMNRLERDGMRSVSIINGGSGADEHPTQALLDMYTIQRTFDFDQAIDDGQRLRVLQNKYPDVTPGMAGKTYVFCGDMGRGRTVRSLATVLANYPANRMVFVSPNHPTLQLSDEIHQRLMAKGVQVHMADSLDSEIDGQSLLSVADCLYMTRIQREYSSASEQSEFDDMDLDSFRLTPKRAQSLRDYCPILHPFPRDSVVGEIPTEIDTDPRVMYFRQARNGMWARAALLVHMFDVADDLYMIYNRQYRERPTRKTIRVSDR